jgi:hypothetical protein
MRRLLLVLLLALAPIAPEALAGGETMHRAPEGPWFQDPPPVPRGFEAVEGTNVSVYGHPESSALLLDLARKGSDAVPRIATQLGVPLGERVLVFVARDDAEFVALQPGRPPEWADGTAWPDRGTVFLRSPRARGNTSRPIERVLEHEIAHVVLGRVFAPHEPPRWLQEGVAQYVAGEVDPSVVPRLARGMTSRGLFTLDELQPGFPKDAAAADLAYAQSGDFVAWLVETHGEESLRLMIRAFARGATIDGAVYEATGDTLDEVDAAWRERLVDGPPLWFAAMAIDDLLWLGTGGLALGALVAARRRMVRRKQRMAEREAAIAAMLAARPEDDPTIH